MEEIKQRIPLPSHLLFILKECKYNVQQRHSTKQWRAAEQKRWSCRGGGWVGRGLCTERRGQGLRVSQRMSNQTSAPGVLVTAKCLRWITVWSSKSRPFLDRGVVSLSLQDDPRMIWIILPLSDGRWMRFQLGMLGGVAKLSSFR